MWMEGYSIEHMIKVLTLRDWWRQTYLSCDSEIHPPPPKLKLYLLLLNANSEWIKQSNIQPDRNSAAGRRTQKPLVNPSSIAIFKKGNRRKPKTLTLPVIILYAALSLAKPQNNLWPCGPGGSDNKWRDISADGTRVAIGVCPLLRLSVRA
ncbi:hypothetical protein JZ751_029538, partial [Albula glossodonta]